jgi:hypothetical protein
MARQPAVETAASERTRPVPSLTEVRRFLNSYRRDGFTPTRSPRKESSQVVSRGRPR